MTTKKSKKAKPSKSSKKSTSKSSKKAKPNKKTIAKSKPSKSTKPSSKPKSKPVPDVSSFTHDKRVPPIGTKIERVFHGETHIVTVMDNGFKYKADHFRGLSGVAKAITGNETNGYAFFGLDGKPSTKTFVDGVVQKDHRTPKSSSKSKSPTKAAKKSKSPKRSKVKGNPGYENALADVSPKSKSNGKTDDNFDPDAFDATTAESSL